MPGAARPQNGQRDSLAPTSRLQLGQTTDPVRGRRKAIGAAS
jgi:hypothetical protein